MRVRRKKNPRGTGGLWVWALAYGRAHVHVFPAQRAREGVAVLFAQAPIGIAVDVPDVDQTHFIARQEPNFLEGKLRQALGFALYVDHPQAF